MAYKKNEKKDRKRMILFWLLCLTFLLLLTSSYAWFSANRVVSVETLDVHIQAEGGFEVSTDAINWKQVITAADIQNAHASYPGSINQIPYQLNPVSTGGGVSGGYLDMFLGDVVNTGPGTFALTAQKDVETEGFGKDSKGNFIAFDLFFKTSTPKALYLSSNSEVAYKGETSSGIENAVRVAFLDEGSAASGGQGLSGATEATIWEPNSDVHTEHGVEQARDVYGLSTSMTGASRLPYYGISAPIPKNANVLVQNANSIKFPSLFSSVTPKISTSKNGFTNQEVLTLKPTITKMRIYMWVEGQDVDCEDNASFGDISFGLEFTTNPS